MAESHPPPLFRLLIFVTELVLVDGHLLAGNHKANKVIVEGINVQKKHKKARSAQEVSAIQSQPGPIDASNVMVICPVCNKATRVAYQVEGDKKARICKKCGAVLDASKEAKEVKKATKRKTKKAAEATAEEK